MQTRSQLRGTGGLQDSRRNGNARRYETPQQQQPVSYNPPLERNGHFVAQEYEVINGTTLPTSSIPSSRRTSFLPQRTTSVRQADSSKTQAPGTTEPQNKHLSPTKAIGSGLQRSQSMKQWDIEARSKHTRTHQRQTSITGTTLAGEACAIPPSSHIRGLRSGLKRLSRTVDLSVQDIATVADGQTSGTDGSLETSSDPWNMPRAPSQSNAMLRKPRPRSMIVMTPQQQQKDHQPHQNACASVTEDVKLSGGLPAVHPALHAPRDEHPSLQNYSTPQRSARIPTSYVATKPTAEKRVADMSSQEIAELKSTLLYLHLLHRDSALVQEQWQSSAERSYRRRFEILAITHKDLLARENDLQEQINANALLKWCQEGAGFTVDGNVRLLSAAIAEVYDLSGVNGKYAGLIQDFEHWHARASRTREIRSRSQQNPTRYVDVVEGIGDRWKTDAALLTTKLLSCGATLEKLGDALPASDLARTLQALSAATKNMLEELSVIQSIERMIVDQEQVWIEEQIVLTALD